MLSNAQRVALDALVRNHGSMIVSIDQYKTPQEVSGALAALACLGACVRAGYVTHEQVTDAGGLFSITDAGRAVLRD